MTNQIPPPLVEWDDYFMSLAYLVASRSKDERTKIGAVIVGPHNEVRSLGYNSFPRGIQDNIKERQSPQLKPFFFSHAERNAIYNAAMVGTPLNGCKMYTNGIPCCDCCWGIINSGISEVIVDEEWNKNNYGRWLEHAENTKIMFGEAGVSLRYWSGELLQIHKYRNGQIIY